MNIKQTVMLLKGMILACFVFAAAFSSTVALAADALPGNKNCGVDTSIISCPDANPTKRGVENTGLWSVLILAVNILTAGVGVLAVAGVVYASIMYASAGGSTEQTKKAMGIITNIVIGVIAYALMYTGLNFLIPGGIFN